MDKANLDFDLMRSDFIVEKCKNKIYAQHLYAALCNNRFFKTDQEWTCSWRMSGGIVADLRHCGENYIDWYCSGIGLKDDSDFMSEGCVSDEIREDLLSLGWIIEPYDCVENNIENI
jgi:hypothetical protein